MSTSFSAFILGQEVYKYYQPAFAYSQLEVAISFYQTQIKNDRGKRPCQIIYSAASSMFSIKIPYPRVGSFTSTWVTAPTSLPF